MAEKKTFFLPATGKGYALAFFLIFSLQCICVPVYGTDFPVINRLDSTDTGFRQFASDVERNRRRLSGVMPRPQEAADNLTIFQYTVRSGEDIFFLAARCNIPYSALASLNRITNPASLEAGRLIMLPSCPGIYMPENLESDLELLIGASRINGGNSIEIRITMPDRPQIFHFFPGADFTQTERTFFLHSGFRFPLRQYRLTSAFGVRTDPFSGNISMHQGVDLAAPEGTEVFAAADGTVTDIGEHPVYGNYIIISHSGRWTSLYGHLQRTETDLRTEVRSGNLIGRVGSTGQSTGPHLHFELRQDGRAVDPAGRLRH